MASTGFGFTVVVVVEVGATPVVVVVPRGAGRVLVDVVVVVAGAPLTPARLGVLASVGCVEPLVVPPARVQVVPTGDELVPPDHYPGAGQIRESNSTVLRAIAAASGVAPALAEDKIRVAMVVKALGIGFFDACRDGGLDAAKELGNVELIYTGPTKTTAEEQIAVIDSLVAQKVDAMAISANDTNALVPVCKKAMSRGIKVISFDSGIAPEGRIMQLDPSNPELIGNKCVQMMAKTLNNEGDVAILSATAQATNQNTWIEFMKKEWAKPGTRR